MTTAFIKDLTEYFIPSHKILKDSFYQQVLYLFNFSHLILLDCPYPIVLFSLESN